MADPASRLLAAYRLATRAAGPLAQPLLAWRLRRGKEDPARLAERYGVASRARPAGPLVWVHAASVGETVSVLPLVDRIVAGARLNVLLTSGTVTSARIAEARLGAGLIHQYAPLDGPRFVRRFLDHWRPGLAIFAESELWPNMILEAAGRGIGLCLVNARMSDRSFNRWRGRGAAMARQLLGRFELCLAQSEIDAGRLSALGAARVSTTGNLKFDVPPPPAAEADLAQLSAAIAARPCWAAASLHPGEDETVLEAHALIAAARPGLLTILAPRHPERGAEIAARARAAGLRTACRSSERVPQSGTDVFVMDSIGELGLVFRLALVAFMGGSLVPHGGQNPIEPAKLGAGIVHGPHVANFADIYAALDASGGALTAGDAAGIAGHVATLLDDRAAAAMQAQAARDTLARFTGALERTMVHLEPLLAAASRQG